MLEALASLFVDAASDPCSLASQSLITLPMGSESTDLRQMASASELRTVPRLTAFFWFAADVLSSSSSLSEAAPALLLERTLSFLAAGFPGTDALMSDPAQRRPERECALVRLLEHADRQASAHLSSSSSSFPSSAPYDIAGLLKKCRQAYFYDACVYLYKRRGDPVHVLECYMRMAEADGKRLTPIFAYIAKILSAPATPSATRAALVDATLLHLRLLVGYDSDRIARLMMGSFSSDSDRVVGALVRPSI
jgi:hypothetical protein